LLGVGTLADELAGLGLQGQPVTVEYLSGIKPHKNLKALIKILNLTSMHLKEVVICMSFGRRFKIDGQLEL
jgi:hypothetical protein